MNRAELRGLACRWRGLRHCGDLTAPAGLHDVRSSVDRSFAGRGSSRDAFVGCVAVLHRAFLDSTTAVAAPVVDEPAQAVAVRWTSAGTHGGDLMGEPPSGAGPERLAPGGRPV